MTNRIDWHHVLVGMAHGHDETNGLHGREQGLPEEQVSQWRHPSPGEPARADWLARLCLCRPVFPGTHIRQFHIEVVDGLVRPLRGLPVPSLAGLLARAYFRTSEHRGEEHFSCGSGLGFHFMAWPSVCATMVARYV